MRRVLLPTVLLLVLLLVAILLALLAVAPVYSAEEAPPFPAGKSVLKLEGLDCRIEMPERWDPAKERSLLVCLHGAGATAESIASWFEPLVPCGFVVLAPQATGPAWSKADVDAVTKIVTALVPKLRIGAGRLHATGFSNGGMNLPPLVFTDDLPFATACFMGSGFGGGKVPERAKAEMAALTLAGTEDPFYGAAHDTPKRLEGKVRRADFLAQEGLGHEIPDKLLPFYYHWLRAMEGRFFPGDDQSFPWIDDLAVAKEALADGREPSFVYFFDERDKDGADAKLLQNEVFLDRLVQHYGRRLTAVKLDRELEPEYFTSLGLAKTPAIVVMKPGTAPVTKFEGKIEAKALADALRAVAADKSPPK